MRFRSAHIKLHREYLPELEAARAAREESLKVIKEDSMNRLMKDLEIDRVRNPNAALHNRWDPVKEGQEYDDDDDMDVNIIDRSKHTSSFIYFGDFMRVVFVGEEPWPGQYIDVMKMPRRNEDGPWPRPG